MIAITALLATVCPNVGPTDSLEKLDVPPKRWSSLVRMSWTFVGCSSLVEIWKTFSPRSLFWTFWMLASVIPLRLQHRADWRSRSPGCVSAVVIRVPDVKSMPRLRPLPPIASAPISRITPDIEKNHFDLPMKSKRQRLPARCAPTAAGFENTRLRPIVARIACVAITAVNSETNVPMPSVKAKPLTPAVASTNRMNAVMIVTTFASMIAVRPLL